MSEPWRQTSGSLSRPGRGWRWLIVGGTCLLVLAHFYDVVTGREHWPISNYPMYSNVRPAELTVSRLYGVVAQGTNLEDYQGAIVSGPDGLAEFEISSGRFVPPINGTRLRNAFYEPLRRRSRNYNPAAAERMVKDYLRLYEERRLAGLHDGPPLVGVRLYQVTRPIVSHAANLNEPATRVLTVQMPEAFDAVLAGSEATP